MTPSPIALDTNAVLSPDFMSWLRRHHTQKVLSPIAYAELAYGYYRRHGSTESLDTMLQKNKIRVEQFKAHQGRITAEFVKHLVGTLPRGATPEDYRKAWNEAWRDCAIASQAAYSPWRLLTFERNGFPFLGWRAKNPYEFKDQVEAGTEERRELGEEDE